MKKWIICAALAWCWAAAVHAAAEESADWMAERERLLRAMRPYSSRVQALAAREAAEALAAEPVSEALPMPTPAPTPAPRASVVPEGTALPLDPVAWEAFARMLPDAAAGTSPEAAPTPASPLGAWYARVAALDEALYQADLEAETLPEKIVYLTIDDGPGPQTHDLLEVLDRYKIRATFFLVGDRIPGQAQLLQDIVAEGHVVANHSQSHDRERLTQSVESFERELLRMERSVCEVLGDAVPIRILRVPYGHGTVGGSFLRRANEMGYLWIDWNATNDDARGEAVSERWMVSVAVSPVNKADRVVLLIHENKKQTVRTLPEIIERYLAAGYVFHPLTVNVERMAGVPMSTPCP